MSSVVHVGIHPSQFPANVRRALLESLRSRRVNHKFHYDSLKQSQRWLALHQAYSPSRNDADCAAAYDWSFDAAVAQIDARRVHVIGLGCGGGQKDTRLLSLLQGRGKAIAYTPCDVGVSMVLEARQTALAVVSAENCFPFVCDLAVADDLPAVFEQQSHPGTARLFTFFGMIPNFEPQMILPRLAALVRPGDFLLFSANLAPGPDYFSGLQRVLPQYDNALTRDWLMTFLLDLGVKYSDGEMRFTIEDGPAGSGLKKIAARFHFAASCRIETDGELFEFQAGDDIQLFFSYRYTPALVRRALEGYRLAVLNEWVTRADDEGVFLCGRA